MNIANTRWRVVFPIPRCCRCQCDALVCLVGQSHDKAAVKRNKAAIARWKARSKRAEEMLRGAVSASER